MHDSFSSSPTIDEIASVACLDKFHFLKLFKIFFGITPLQYLVKLKLEHAYNFVAIPIVHANFIKYLTKSFSKFPILNKS